MKQNFIINDTPLVLELTFMRLEHLLIDVTCVEDTYRNYIASGLRFIELEGTTEDGKQIDNKFQVMNKDGDVLVLKSIRQ
jgi:hypothetical protein